MSVTHPYFIFSVLLLAALLFFPASKIIWLLSMRRLQRKTGREPNPEEIAGQRQRARFIAVFLVLIFSYLFNLNLLGTLYGNG
ncbi:MAG: hypothetical protein V2J55_15905 [Candidatus Competibacteraceae bacterium]|jgi:hypothetical protein|nr:hypothetical protein [Candidatus Competibacteraceae bacterium]